MNLNEAQRKQVWLWLEQGLKVADVQKKLAAELSLKLTYMEVRFLLDDLKLQPKDPEPPKAETPATPAAPAGVAAMPAEAPAGTPATAAPPPGGGTVKLSVDAITRAGAMVSGKVTFSDSQTAAWHLDQFGRLGFAPTQQGYKPSQADIMAFQDQLQGELARLGF